MRSLLTVIALVGLSIGAAAQATKQVPAPANLKPPPPNAAKKTFVISSVVLKPGNFGDAQTLLALQTCLHVRQGDRSGVFR